MRKKIIFETNHIVIGVLIFILSSLITYIHTEQLVHVYLYKLLIGEYNTTVEVENISREQLSAKTAFYDGKYYYYNQVEKAICEFGEGTKIIDVEQEPTQIAVMEKYLYYASKNSLYQYRKNGIKVAEYHFDEKEVIDKLAIYEENVYCQVVEKREGNNGLSIYIFDAKDISTSGDIRREENEQDDALLYYEDDRYSAEYSVENWGNLWLVSSTNRGKYEIKEREDAVKIYIRNTYDGLISIIDADTKEPILSYKGYILAFDNNHLYTSVNKLACLDENGEWINFANQLQFDFELEYSQSVVDDNYLIENIEEYVAKDSYYGRIPKGSVGELLNDKLVYIDLKTNEVKFYKDISNGQVIYMDAKQYAVMSHNKVMFYSSENDELVKTEYIEGFQMGKDWSIELCGNKIFFISEGCIKAEIDVEREFAQ